MPVCYRLCYPTILGALVYGIAKRRVNDRSRIGLHAFGRVHVDIGRGADLAMAKALARDL
jgi:hypothetical protein